MATPPHDQLAATQESPAVMPASADTSQIPTYPEMIIAAITALKDKNGSSTPAIGEYIELNFMDLPSTHWTLLTHHLKAMKNAGQLVTSDNGSHMLSSSDYLATAGDNDDAPATSVVKRGRGRPPKPKPQEGPDGSPAVVQSGQKRGRGRPPKPKPQDGPDGSPAVGQSGQKRGRGRPPKPKPQEGPDGSPAVVQSGQKRGRGRPPKASSTVGQRSAAVKTPGRGRGRPRKNAMAAAARGSDGSLSSAKAQKVSGRPRGRPRKDATTAAAEQQEQEDLKDRLEYIQSRIKNAAAIVKPHVSNQTALRALEDLEKLTDDAS